MLSKIRNFFLENVSIDEKITEKHDINTKVAIATCVLLLEMANTDEEFSDIEISKIESLMKNEFGLSAEKLQEIIQLAEEARQESHDLWQFTNLINENYTRPQKIQLIELVWRVVYADGKVDKYEEYLVRKLSNLLDLKHKEMIEAKLQVKYENERD